MAIDTQSVSSGIMTRMTFQDHAVRVTPAAEVRAELARRQMSGRELARQLNRTPVYVARRLSGEVELSATDLQRIASVLHVTVGQFFGEAPE